MTGLEDRENLQTSGPDRLLCAQETGLTSLSAGNAG